MNDAEDAGETGTDGPSEAVPRRVEVRRFSREVEERRRRARERADAIQKALGDEAFLRWFDELYAEASETGDAERIPWADLEPHPLLVKWLADTAPHAGRALEVGCGLGDNAAALADAGYAVTAFDISPHAVKWARRRFPDQRIDWRVANLLEPPAEWRGAFDLVHETYTLQSLPPAMRPRAVEALASFLKPGGRLLLVCRSRPADVAPEGPPWPLAAAELAALDAAGLTRLRFEPFIIRAGREIPHLLALWRKPE